MKDERKDKKNLKNPVDEVPAQNQNTGSGISNEANRKGAVDEGRHGTKPTASQQQGQGSWNAKDRDEHEKN
jgi:hypothetical protein